MPPDHNIHFHRKRAVDWGWVGAVAAYLAAVGTIVVIFALWVGHAFGVQETMMRGCPQVLTHVDGAKARAQKGWNAELIKTSEPAQKRSHLQASCVPPGNPEKYVKAKIAEAKRGYRAARDQQQSITPYYFGEGGDLEYVAIPPAIVRCETEGYSGAGRWEAVNAESGAFGPYELLPSTYLAYCESCDRSHWDQHLAAHRVLMAQGTSAWACA